MHELSIAMRIVEIAEEEAERHGGAQVQAIHMRLGMLSGVVKEALLSAYEMACFTTPLEGSRLLIEEIPIEVFCSSCNTIKPVHSIQLFCCSDCGALTSNVVHGREMEVVAMEITE